MKSIIIVAFLLVGIAAEAQVDTKAQALISFHKKKFSWLIQKKTDSLKTILDDRVMYVHSNGVVETKTDMINNLKDGSITYANIQIDEAKARLYGDTGIITGKGLFEGKWGENTFSLRLSYTEVYVKVKKQWMLVSRASCRITD